MRPVGQYRPLTAGAPGERYRRIIPGGFRDASVVGQGSGTFDPASRRHRPGQTQAPFGTLVSADVPLATIGFLPDDLECI